METIPFFYESIFQFQWRQYIIARVGNRENELFHDETHLYNRKIMELIFYYIKKKHDHAILFDVMNYIDNNMCLYNVIILDKSNLAVHVIDGFRTTSVKM